VLFFLSKSSISFLPSRQLGFREKKLEEEKRKLEELNRRESTLQERKQERERIIRDFKDNLQKKRLEKVPQQGDIPVIIQVKETPKNRYGEREEKSPPTLKEMRQQQMNRVWENLYDNSSYRTPPQQIPSNSSQRGLLNSTNTNTAMNYSSTLASLVSPHLLPPLQLKNMDRYSQSEPSSKSAEPSISQLPSKSTLAQTYAMHQRHINFKQSEPTPVVTPFFLNKSFSHLFPSKTRFDPFLPQL
jgi:myosin heavy subunit